MENFFEKNKAKFTIFGIIIILLIIIIVPTIIISNNKEREEYFPTYEKLEVKKSDFVDKKNENYIKVKKQLEADYLFSREAIISNYYYKNYTSADLKNMLWNFIFSYELSNTKDLSSIDYTSGYFCMRSHYVIDAFQELYNVKITQDIDLLPGFYEYVYKKGDKYCFNFANVGKDYDNQIKVAVEDLDIDDDKTIKANIYVYEYYTSDTDSEKAYISNLITDISNSDYTLANNIVLNNLKGKVTHKQLSFRVHNNGNFFKYQILQSKNLSY
ncbi:MAG: hypothetical protein IKR57_06255 [Bacilli bacterium]|nr:hypothetical protein [Bacilli bacterium]